MSQLRLTFAPSAREADLSQAADASLVIEEGLETLVAIILHTDAPARDDDDVAVGDRRGYWADVYEEEDEDDGPTGSYLWTLERRTLTPETLRDGERIASDALQRLVTAGVCARVEVTSARIDNERAGFTAKLYRTEDDTSPYQTVWTQHFASL
jgi:phage gp46-like protein